MKISCATSVLLQYTLDEAVQIGIDAGLDGLDLWCGRPHMYRGDYSPKKLGEIRVRIEARGLETVSAMPAFFRYPFSLSSPVEAIRQDSVDYMCSCIDNALLMGAKHVLVVPSTVMKNQSVRDAHRLFLRSMDQICTYAADYGVTLGIEPVHKKLCGYMCSSKQVEQTIGAMGGARIGAVIDTGHIQLSDESFECWTQTLGDSILQVHINDNNGKEQQNNLPGDGVIDFSADIAALRAIGYNGYITLELGWHYSFAPVEPLRCAIKRLRTLVKEA